MKGVDLFDGQDGPKGRVGHRHDENFLMTANRCDDPATRMMSAPDFLNQLHLHVT